MRRHLRFRASIVVAAFLAAGESAFGGEQNSPAITVLAYNYAAIPPGTMVHAREKVIRIYRDAGVSVVWLDPPVDSGNARIDSTPHSVSTFAVRMLLRPKRANAKASTLESVMGRALAASDTGGYVSVFYDQVVSVSRKYQQRPADILALAIAHEIGHLLLPYPAHSPTGIMRADLDGDDIRHFVVGTLGFTSAQAADIRERARCC